MTDFNRRDEPAKVELVGRRWLPCKNTAGTAVPAYGAVRVSGSLSDGVLEVAQPNADGQQVFLNGPTPIPAGAFGAVSDTMPAVAAYDSTSGTPAAGETWGAKSGEWTLNEGQAGFLVLGGANTTLLTVNVTREWGAAAAFSGARVAHDSGSPQSINNATLTTVTWANEIHDEGGYWAGGAPTVFTAPADGYYLVTASLGFASNTTGVRQATIQLTTGQLAAGTALAATGALATAISLSGVGFMEAGDTAWVTAYQTSGGALNIDAGTSQFAITRVGT